MRRRRWLWLLFAAALFALSAYLMSLGDEREVPLPELTRVELPRRMDDEAKSRAVKRRVNLPAPMALASDPTVPKLAQDPVLRAMRPEVKRVAMVVEANAVRHSPVGQLLVDCIASGGDGRQLERFKERVGVDPLEQIDRVVLSDETVILSGHFQGAKWDQLFSGSNRTDWGQRGALYEMMRADGGSAGIFTGSWGDQMLVVGESREEVASALDRIEGRTPYQPPPIDESQTYGEIYGVLSTGALAEMLAEDQPEVAERLRQAAEKVELHVDTSHDVGVVADVRGVQQNQTRDLAKAVGAALALARLKAQTDEEKEIASLLEQARVQPGTGQFRVEMGVPLEVLKKHLERCVQRNEARRAAGAQP